MSDTNPNQSPGTEPDSGGPGRPRRQAAIAFILLTIFIDILGIGIVIPVLPKLVQELLTGSVESTTEGANTASLYYGIIAAVYALMQFVFAPIVGALSDRYGRRPIILGSLFGLGIDFLIQGFANNIVWLFVGRMLAGVMGASFSTANAYIADVSNDDTRARNFGFVGMMFGLGFTIGPALGGVLGSYDIRLPFFVAAGLAFVNWMYGFFILPESLPPEKRSPFTIANANPFNSIKHLRAYPFVAGIAIVFVCKALAQRGLENVWVLSTNYRFGWDEMTNGKALCLVGIMAIIVQGGMVRPVIKRLGERKAILIATVISAIAFLAYGLASEGWMMYWIIVVGSLGGIAGPAIQSLITSRVDETEQGKIQGALTSLTSVTNVIAPLFFTAGLFKFFTSEAAPVKIPGAPFLVGALLLIVALFIAISVFKRFPDEETSEPTE
ncbi:TCR/Tet family MFS transporter [Planctomycetes bacterium K23_9]|uniref:Tetracycline resistance protein, class C n=1 Tax=Stieleria marina TaxID=1930275 RepID=A0A517NMF2_9BACT|nr:Tetracycline resistance protein, class C [Planctomycetes bacterium K23_9]